MKYCKKCVMPDTRPGISFNEEGICSACQSYERRKSIDWSMIAEWHACPGGVKHLKVN